MRPPFPPQTLPSPGPVGRPSPYSSVLLFQFPLPLSVCSGSPGPPSPPASPGLAMLLRTAMGSFLFHFCSSSCILSILAGLRAHRQPLREELPDLFSTFSKHLLRERLWRTEFFQPSGAVCRGRARQEMRPGSDSQSWLRVRASENSTVHRIAARSGPGPPQHPTPAPSAPSPSWWGKGWEKGCRKLDHKLFSPKICLSPTQSRMVRVTHKGTPRPLPPLESDHSPWSLCLESFVERELVALRPLVPT